MRRSRALLATALAGFAIGATALARKPPGRPDAERMAGPLFAGADIDAKTLGIIERSCRNCHSDRVQWPWYSSLPPASWLLHRDVARARERVDFSRWAAYSAPEKQALLSAIGAAARAGVMPPSRYTFMHRASVLSPEDRERVYRWTRAERARLRKLDERERLQRRPATSQSENVAAAPRESTCCSSAR